MTDLSENDVLSEVSEVSNTDTQQVLTDADIDAINEALAEAESTIAENETVELSGNSEQLETEPVNEIDNLEPEPYVCPWADAPDNVIYYEKIYDDGHLGSSTESAEMAYKMGWYENRISKDDVQQSDVNGWTYRKEVCPMKSEHDLQIEVWNREIFELKEELNATDYKAIKYAEGVMTDDEYQPVGIQRQAWRHRINELEELIRG